MIADNKLHEATGWHDEKLAGMLQEFDLDDLPGWTEDDLEEINNYTGGGGETTGEGGSQTTTGSGSGSGSSTKSADSIVVLQFRCPHGIRIEVGKQIRNLIDEAVVAAKAAGTLGVDVKVENAEPNE